MNYLAVLKPVSPITGKAEDSFVDTDGARYDSIPFGQVTGLASTIIQAVPGLLAVASEAQLEGLSAYVTAIKAGTNTGAVETAIAGL